MELSTALAVLPKKIAERVFQAAGAIVSKQHPQDIVWRVSWADGSIDGWLTGLDGVEYVNCTGVTVQSLASSVQTQAATLVRRALSKMLVRNAEAISAANAVSEAYALMLGTEGAEVGKNLSGGDENGPGKIDSEAISGGQARNKASAPATVPSWQIEGATPPQMAADKAKRFAEARERLQGSGQATGWDSKSR